MSTNPRWPRGGSNNPAPPPPPPVFPPLIASAILERTEGDSLKFLAFTNATPGAQGMANLPGTTNEEKVIYYVDWLEEAFEKGLTAWDLYGSQHDSAGLMRAHPFRKSGGERIENPHEAVDFYFPEGWYDTLAYYNLQALLASNPLAADAKIAQYRKTAGE